MENESTAKRIFELLDYNPEIGNFTWKTKGRGKHKVGSVAGCVHPHGYVRISIDYRLYNAHRIAWLFITGKWPSGFIDHIDGNRSNNKPENLRECTQQQNCFNKKISKANRSGYKGVSFVKATQKWGAWIKVNKRSINLGCSFDTPEEAFAAYTKAAQKFHGEFAHLSICHRADTCT